MRGITSNSQAYLLKTKVTCAADPGTTLTAGATIVFPKAFVNIPASCVVCVLGTVNLASLPASVWTSTCTTTQCVISLESALPSEYWGQSFIVGVFVHEQL